jgi:CYTH domain-containing protein
MSRFCQVLNSGKPEGIVVKEFEYKIPMDDARQLLDLCDSETVIKKERYTIEHDDLCWEVDRMLGRHQGIHLIEVELSSVDQVFAIPEWMSKMPYRDVSEDVRFKNARMGKMTDMEIQSLMQQIASNLNT